MFIALNSPQVHEQAKNFSRQIKPPGRHLVASVALLDTAAALCTRRDVDARQVIYLPCDGMAAQDGHRCLVLGRELTRSVDLGRPRPRVWLQTSKAPRTPGTPSPSTCSSECIDQD